MATYETSLSSTAGLIVGPGYTRQVVCATAIVTLATAMTDNANDDVGLFRVPKGAVIVGGTISATDMDSSTGLAIDVGDAGAEARLFAASTVGQAATLSSALAPAGHLYKYTAETQIRAYIQTAVSGTAASGTLKVSLLYFVDEEFSTTALTAA